jgi:hypothetical protein
MVTIYVMYMSEAYTVLLPNGLYSYRRNLLPLRAFVQSLRLQYLAGLMMNLSIADSTVTRHTLRPFAPSRQPGGSSYSSSREIHMHCTEQFRNADAKVRSAKVGCGSTARRQRQCASPVSRPPSFQPHK